MPVELELELATGPLVASLLPADSDPPVAPLLPADSDPPVAPLLTDLAVTLAWVAGAVTIAYLVGLAVSWALQRAGRRSDWICDIALLTRRPVRAGLMVIAASVALQRNSSPQASWRPWVDHSLRILAIVAATWLIARLVIVVERRMVARFGGGNTGLTDADLQRRKVLTQLTVLRRLALAVVVLMGLAAALMTFPSFADVGKTMFASAGVLSVVAGLAAQTSLGSVFAGLQIAFTDAIRVGDVVVLEEEWGRIEEITLTYVVVQVWDERRLVLPCTYFTTTPFQNWTRSATELLGTVLLDVDFSVPLDAMRTELDRLLTHNDLWDGRSGVLQVVEATNGTVRVRITVSAPNAGALWDLQCAVREGMVVWLQRSQSGALPRWRFEPGPAPSGPPAAHDSSHARPAADEPGLFSGTEAGEQRAKAFDGPGEETRQLIKEESR
ncbi:mechanosensitive ion channel domain-containing protein [Mycobacterium sp. AMU20-3851]|uniref:mechanosensitive ion channel family protein n=1 Tax=Mycobacterium sp. AMU20-3851 TaxID=3122055 RepID=UPI003754591E